MTTPKGIQDYGDGEWGSSGRHGHARALRSRRASKAKGWGNTGNIEETWLHTGALKARAVFGNLKGTGVLGGYMATHGSSKGWGLHAKIKASDSFGSQD